MATVEHPENKVAVPEYVPYHLAIIMDGNGRWARARGMPRQVGHRAGVENLRRVIRGCVEFGVRILTVYAFSTENWGRPEAEVRALLGILNTVIERELDTLDANGVQLRHIGEISRLSPDLQNKVSYAIERTRNNDRLVMNLAFNYGGRDEIVRAVRRIVQAGIPAEQIDETLIGHYLDTAGQPDVDLLIRTGGDMRISNFLIWQGHYAEYYVTPTFWPDFDKEELRKAILFFGQRERRFGLVK
jgi:undecaprenyl diphosphate synthase